MIPSFVGLAIGFVGTLLIACSIRKGKVEVWKDNPEELENAGRFDTRLLRLGLALLALGFLLQIWGESLK